MRKQLAIIGIVALLVCIGLSGCNQISNSLNNEKNKFIGTWKGTISEWGTGDLTIVLFSDSTFSLRTFSRTLLGAFSGTWVIKMGNLY